jgi:hypothetical protein
MQLGKTPIRLRSATPESTLASPSSSVLRYIYLRSGFDASPDAGRDAVGERNGRSRGRAGRAQR